MDSIERMRRINDLTRELKHHGFAESSFEAIGQANQIYGSDELDESVKHGLIKNSTHDRIMKESQAEKDETMSDEYNDRKLAKVADTVQVLTDKMNEIIRAINDLDTRITEIKSKQDKLMVTREQRIESRVEPRVEVKVETSIDEKPVDREITPKESAHDVAQSNVEGHVKKDEYAMNQRTGNFQSQDVSIDKMFYFGNKK